MAALPFTIRRRPVPAQAGARAAAVVAAGLIAGLVAIALMQWASVVAYDESPWKLPRMMAALVAGPAALADDAGAMSPIVLGLAVHFALSLLYAALLAGMLAKAPREHAPLVGLAFGAALYAANLHGFTLLFPWFAELRTLDTLVAHAAFGLVAAGAYCEFSQPAEEDID